MYSNKTLVGIGCSHVFGSLGNDYDPKTCHERSWVKKLETIGNFKSSVNLGEPGGSNLCSERKLLEYLKDNYTKDLVVIISITQLSRTEFINAIDGKANDFLKIGSWMAAKEAELETRTKNFIEIYYGCFHDNNNDIRLINQQVLMIHSLLKSLNIEHYFFEMLCLPKTISRQQLGFTFPVIEFYHNSGSILNANGFLTHYGHAPKSCCHWDHEGNEFLANYLLKKMKEIRNE